ncbi:hypothetical protein [Sphingomonas aerolata]|uniref:Y-family DNA polymerase n=1 Tax=Sphingomonas aerolata TaxID=185951 RepID=UPI002FDF1E7D
MVTAFHATPLALIGKVGRREEVVAACALAASLGIAVGMAATHARALVSDLDFRPAEPEADAALLDHLALRAVRRWTPIAAATPPDGLWLDLTGCDHLYGGEERFCQRLRAFASAPASRPVSRLRTHQAPRMRSLALGAPLSRLCRRGVPSERSDLCRSQHFA